mgnify:CR=1 FL=1
MSDNLIQMPNYAVNLSSIPDVMVSSIRFQNFKSFDDVTFDFFGDDGKIKSFACFYGPNGTGKSTILDVIQLIFTRFEGYDLLRLKQYLGKSVRHTDGKLNGLYGEDDFLITAKIKSDDLTYDVEINKSGFVKDHPKEVKEFITRLCYYARFDQELHQFQLIRSKWDLFKELFESVTGYPIVEKTTLFDQSDDPEQAEMLKKYVLSFWIHKPNEVISREECSAGERKVIKSFSTLLNKEYTPKIILIDNVEMHIESGRHLQLIDSMKRCFPNSQIFTTTHSHRISKNFDERHQLYDLRRIRSKGILKDKPWRIYLIDEIEDSLLKLRAVTMNVTSSYKGTSMTSNDVEIIGKEILKRCYENCDEKELLSDAEEFLSAVSLLFVRDNYSYYSS